MATIQNRIVLEDGVSSVIDRIANKMSGLGGIIQSTFGQFTFASLAANAIASIGEAVADIPGKLADTADQYSGIQARLMILTNDQQKVKQLNDEIYASALRARGSFDGMADAVTKIGLTAKEAFPDVSDVVPFVEGVQKLFAIGGTDAQQQASAMLQLTQALGSGRLQGDEFRSIAEAAPMIEQMVAKTMGVTQGQLKELSSQGAITADIIKRAIFENIDEINGKFSSMPMTFSQIGQQFETIAYKAFTPVFEQISKLANSDAFIGIFETLSTVLFTTGQIIANVIGWLYELSDTITETAKWAWQSIFGVNTSLRDVLLPTLAFISAAVMAFGALWLVANASMIAHAVTAGIVSAAQMVAQGVTWLWAAATSVLSAAVNTLTGGLGILLAVLVGIPVIIALIVGAFFAWGVATNGLRNTIVTAFRSIGEAVDAVVRFSVNAINTLIDGMNSVAGMLNKILPGSAIKLDSHIEYSTNFGENWGNWAANTYDGIADGFGSLTPSMPDLDAGNRVPDFDRSPIDPSGKNTAKNTGRTAKNTGKMADEMGIMEEEIKSMKDYAEQEAINKYTTARVTIDVGGINQNISRDTDVDGVISSLITRLQDDMASGAEAVHA